MLDDQKQQDIKTVEAALASDPKANEAFGRLLGTWAMEMHAWQFAAGLNCAGTPAQLGDALQRNADLVMQFRPAGGLKLVK